MMRASLLQPGTLQRIALLLLAACPAAAASDLHELSKHRAWRALLHYEQNGLVKPPASAVNDPTFFLSDSGRTDPEAELRATIDALQEHAERPGAHAVCQFPARAFWITRMTGNEWPDDIVCPEWGRWWSQHSASSVGLVFVSGYLGNPASYFGHLMIHLDPRAPSSEHRDVGRLLDTSLNFGADIPPDDGIVTYVTKGLIGGYQAKFSQAPFYRNNAIYSETEMRNLWYYKLRLKDWERELLLRHLWEIMGREYDYYFLGQNCATRIAKTLDLVLKEPLNSPGLPFDSPEGIIRAANMVRRNGEPFLESPEYIPSRQLVTNARFDSLARSQKDAALEIWPSIDQFDLEAKQYETLGTADKVAPIETLMSHAAFLKQTTEHEGFPEIERQLLVERLKLPPGKTEFDLEPATPVSQATPPGRVGLSLVHNTEQGSGMRVALRPLHYDLLDSDSARQPGAALEIGRTEVDFGFGEPELRRLVLVRITNLQTESNSLPLMPKYAWHASIEANRRNLDCSDCLDLRVRLLAGKSSRTSQFVAYAMAGTALRTQQHYDGSAAVAFEVGAIANWSSSQRTLATIQYEDSFRGDEGRSMRIHVDHRLGLSRTMDARFGFEGADPGKGVEVTAGFAKYF